MERIDVIGASRGSDGFTIDSMPLAYWSSSVIVPMFVFNVFVFRAVVGKRWREHSEMF